MKNILIVGAGGREHALAWALQRYSTTRPLKLYCAPGNAGIAELAECVPLKPTDITALREFAEHKQIDLTLVGSEAPLAAGIADEFAAHGLEIVGPLREAAQLEASKAFAKNFMLRHRIPTARFRVAESAEEAGDILRSGEFGGEDDQVVVKADGLAAGKGVVVARSRHEAEMAALNLIHLPDQNVAGRIVLEEALSGREASLLLWTDGRDYKLMPAARDYKRVGEGDTGPNTGGMGAVCGPEVLNAQVMNQVVRQVVEPTMQGIQAEKLPFQGVLYVGLMLTPNGPQVLEYNVRFGDPEAQAILMRLDSDLVGICEAIARKRLSELEVNWSEEPSACVVLAARGYPERPESGALIEGLETIKKSPNVQIFHAGTSRAADNSWRTAGGRVLNVAARAVTLDKALDDCYKTIRRIHWNGMHYRRDIGFADAEE